MTLEELEGGRYILRITPNDDVKAAENIETSVTDRSRLYPECLSCYCIQILLTEASYSCQEKTEHDKSRHNTSQQKKWVSYVASRVDQIYSAAADSQKMTCTPTGGITS